MIFKAATAAWRAFLAHDHRVNASRKRHKSRKNGYV